jgi:CTP synthase (UTP-ammonia lyase)
MLQIIELPSHPFFVGVQFHPEFKSRPAKPSALFLGKIAQPLRVILDELFDFVWNVNLDSYV